MAGDDFFRTRMGQRFYEATMPNFTWSCPELSVVDSVVTVDLVDHGERTELCLTHELPPDPKIRQGHEEGWGGCLGNLEKMLNNDE